MLVCDKGVISNQRGDDELFKKCWGDWPHVLEDKEAWMTDQGNKYLSTSSVIWL